LQEEHNWCVRVQCSTVFTHDSKWRSSHQLCYSIMKKILTVCVCVCVCVCSCSCSCSFTGSISSSAANQAMDITSPTGGTTSVTAERPPTAEHHISTPEEVSASPPPSNSPRTPGGTEWTRVSGAPQTDRTSGWTVPIGWTLSSASTPPNANVTPVTPANSTRPAGQTTSADGLMRYYWLWIREQGTHTSECTPHKMNGVSFRGIRKRLKMTSFTYSIEGLQ